MIQQLQITYANFRWHKITTAIMLLLCVVLLYRLADGFPPRLWLFLLQVLPTLPLLWQMRGLALIAPLLGLLLLSCSLFLLWSLLVGILIRTGMHWWQEHQELQRLDQEIAELREQQAQQEQQAANGSIGDAEAYANQWLYGSAGVDPRARPDTYQFPFQQHTTSDPAPDLADDDNVQMFDLAAEETIPNGSPLGSPSTSASTAAVAVQTLVTQLRVAAISDPGVVRKHKPNEDSILAVHAKYTPDVEPMLLGVFAVADGMGGHHNGQEASRTAVQSLRSTLLPALSNEHREEKQCADLLQQSVHRANHAVYQRQREQQKMMGTTITAALVFGMTAYIINVGDSRTYLYRPSDGLRQVTHDHSLVADLVREGAITRAEMYTHPRRNEIYRCLGDGPNVELDAFKVPLREGDILLLCSDGLWEMVHDEDIEQIIGNATSHASQISTQLIQAALNRGGSDNVSVVTVCITRDPITQA